MHIALVSTIARPVMEINLLKQKGKRMNLNDQLTELYSKNWSVLEMQAKSISNITHPLLIKVNEEKYLGSDIKVMIFGQETDGWHGKFPREEDPSTVERIMCGYESYFYGEKNKSKRPFWNKRNFKYFVSVPIVYMIEHGLYTIGFWSGMLRYRRRGAT